MKLFALVPALALAACATTPTSPAPPLPPGPLPLIPTASLFDPVAIPAATFDNPLAAAQHFARYDPSNEGATYLGLVSQRYAGPDTLIMLFSVEGYADDSVQGQQWRIELARVANGWRVTTAGRQVKCYRGATPNVWQKGLCP